MIDLNSYPYTIHPDIRFQIEDGNAIVAYVDTRDYNLQSAIAKSAYRKGAGINLTDNLAVMATDVSFDEYTHTLSCKLYVIKSS